MNTFNKVLISTVGALFAAQTAEAQGIHNSCLSLSDQTAGYENGEFVTNEDQLTGSQVTSGMRLHSVKTCHNDRIVNSKERVTGLQFFMALNPYEAEGEGVEQQTFPMNPIGPMTGDCEVLELPEGLDRITVTLDEAKAGLSIAYRVDGDVLDETYGKLDADDSTVWEFTDANPLVGLYGRASDIEIERLGFITLDTACQVAAEAATEEEKTEEENTEGEAEGENEQGGTVGGEELIDLEENGTDTEKDQKGGLNTVTIVIIVAGVLGFVALLSITLCALRMRKNKLNKIDSPVGSSSKAAENNV